MNNNESNYSTYNQPIFQDDDSIDIKRYLSLFLSNWYWFAIFLFIAITISYGINRYSEDVFNISSSLLIKDETLGGFSQMAPIFPGKEIYKNQQNLKNEIGILKSFELNKQVVDSLPEFQTQYILIGRRKIVEHRRYKDSPFIVNYIDDKGERPGYTFVINLLEKNKFDIAIKGDEDRKKEKNFGDTISWKDFNLKQATPFRFTVTKRDPGTYSFDESLSNQYNFSFIDPVAVANEFRSKLQINPISEEASLVTLTTSGHVPLQEIDYLNKLMDLYIHRGLDEKNRASDQTITFIDDQLDLIHKSLRKAEDTLQKFRYENKLINISDEGSSVRARLENFETQRVGLELRRKYLDYLASYLESRNQSADIISPSVLGVEDPILERLITELADLQYQRSQLSLNLASDQPAIDLLDGKIKVSKAALKENIGSSLHNVKLSIAEVDSTINETQLELSRFPGTETSLIRIKREFDLNNTVYNYLLEKKAEASITRASNVADNKVIDYAGFQNVVQVKPRKSWNNMLAIIFGLTIPMLLILIIDYLNNKVIDKKDVERMTSVPVLGYISHNEYKTETPVLSRPLSTLSESFRSVRTSLNFFLNGVSNPVIAVTSTVSSEGKTFVSINLALITASLGKKVLLIGLDLRKPKIHKVLDIDNSKGMSLYLSGEAGFDEVIFETNAKNLYYATSGPVPPNPAELIESEKMHEFLEEAKKRFDYIIVDTPPIAIVTDALLVARY